MGWKGKQLASWLVSGAYGQKRLVTGLDAYPTRSRAFVKMNCDRLGDLLLQIAEIVTLRRDAARSIRIIPPCYEPARLLVSLDLKGDFFHDLDTIIPYHAAQTDRSPRYALPVNGTPF
jgi:hypothetical protein